jgi:tetratricopeptide (TPR) repeat protein
VARALNNLGYIAVEAGQFDRARSLLAESLELHRAVGDRRGVAGTLNNLAEAENGLGNAAAAMSLYRESYSLFHESGDHLHAAIAVENLGSLSANLGDVQAAEEYFRQALLLYRRVDDQQGIMSSLAGLAATAVSKGNPRQATTLLAAASAIHEVHSHLDFPDVPTTLQMLRDVLGNDDFDALWSEASAAPCDEIIAQVGINAKL